MLRLAAIVLLLGVSPAVADPVHVILNFTCILEGMYEDTPWCGHLTLYEHDSISSHDVLKTDQFCWTGVQKQLQYEVSPGGDLSPNYEINFALSHNCTIFNRMKCFNPKEPKDTTRYGESTVQFDVVLFEEGEEDECKPVA